MSSGVTVFETAGALGAFVALFALAGVAVLWCESREHVRWRRIVRDGLRRLTGRTDLEWVDVRLLTAVAAGAFAAAVSTTWVLGGYGCTPAGPSDLTTLVASGQAFLHGGNPFTVSACGHTDNPVPAGMASVLLDALGSLGGPAGVLLVWGAISTALIPLVWTIGGADRRAATTFVLAGFLYLPIVAVQVDGASLALVPGTVLATLYLARRGWPGAATVGGLLATGRFPAVFPVLGSAGRAGARRLVSTVLAAGAFLAVTLATAGVYGARFTGPVFFSQFARSHLALNYWGVLEGEGWLLPSTAVTVVQAIAVLALAGVVWRWARSEVGAASIVLTGIVLLAQFLSFTELVFLLPVALAGTRARWWLWSVGLVASTNYLIAMRSLADWGGPGTLSYALDLVLTALLLGLLLDLLRTELRRPGAVAPEPSAGPATT